MSSHPFRQVDVFSDRPMSGNPLAVVHDADGLDDGIMQAFARWTNLSESVFLQSPRDARADYRLRIFSQRGEMQFAGHPTLGGCHAWLEAGGRSKGGDVLQECGIGLVRIRNEAGVLSFLAPPLLRDEVLSEAECLRIAYGLGVSRPDVVAARWVDNGAGWRAVLLREGVYLDGLSPDPVALAEMKLGVIAPSAGHPGALFDVRAFVFDGGVLEDPATGSLNAGIATWFAREGLAPATYSIAQGTAIGRDARLHVLRDGHHIWLGGHTVTAIQGSVALGLP
ncbi:PhzF family phenazine biosynthesis isomerase [Luteibacter anthropi]|uniref:PhzF family phenazine biosynthesis protein n=1 Tax=Luteibacter anthropi TaxID=564369 RepID=A0A7X5UAE7_9GAMM|nr:PhzF family phenazine biosynthesis protein [Luteibacter anthropi]NII06707.1 PhzF family phenazine biosynthesis protein [Luteibacter anthropi]